MRELELWSCEGSAGKALNLINRLSPFHSKKIRRSVLSGLGGLQRGLESGHAGGKDAGIVVDGLVEGRGNVWHKGL
jgi:hypothetical protein